MTSPTHDQTARSLGCDLDPRGLLDVHGVAVAENVMLDTVDDDRNGPLPDVDEDILSVTDTHCVLSPHGEVHARHVEEQIRVRDCAFLLWGLPEMVLADTMPPKTRQQLGERKRQGTCKTQQHCKGRVGSPRLDVTQVPRRDLGVGSGPTDGHAEPFAPFAQPATDLARQACQMVALGASGRHGQISAGFEMIMTRGGVSLRPVKVCTS